MINLPLHGFINTDSLCPTYASVLHFRSVPPMLFHYTNGKGVEGILTPTEVDCRPAYWNAPPKLLPCFWATNVSSLQDTSELKFAFDIAVDELDYLIEVYSAEESSVNLKRVTWLNRERSNIASQYQSSNVFITSFTDKEDDLSQWIEFGRHSLGFPVDILQKVCKDNYAELLPCIYNHDTSQTIIREVVRNLLKKYLQLPSHYPISGAYPSLWQYVAKYGSLMKHKSYTSQAEWRLVNVNIWSAAGAGHPPNEMPKISTRESRYSDYPANYVRLDLPPPSDPSMGRIKIMIGPGDLPNPEMLKLSSIRNLLLQQRYFAAHKIAIEHSKIPYRDPRP